ncbi:MAG: LacI family DNA-binding transcriptional regulator [Treponema sp.]|jgi:LacI family transcriptional regulator|nr:LacI family DNA-binding transcriptional regulator [Treponema sp.]
MSRKVTIQDIADELGLSRTTVSKAINNTGSVTEITRKKIFRKAAELGYKQFSLLNVDEIVGITSQTYEIAVFSHIFLGSGHFSFSLLNTFQEKINKLGYRLTMYTVRDEELRLRKLPKTFNVDNTVGILCIEMFDESYCKFLSEIKIPVLFVDTCVIPPGDQIHADILYMENYTSSYIITNGIISTGIKKLGFYGDNLHCQSFYERWKGFRSALKDNELPYTTEHCILEADSSSYGATEWICRKLQELPELPQAFVCANDYLAIRLMKALSVLSAAVPEKIMVSGFDNSNESQFISPALTTVCIPGNKMGTIAADLLLSRINDRTLPFRITYVETEVILRASTAKPEFTD